MPSQKLLNQHTNTSENTLKTNPKELESMRAKGDREQQGTCLELPASLSERGASMTPS